MTGKTEHARPRSPTPPGTKPRRSKRLCVGNLNIRDADGGCTTTGCGRRRRANQWTYTLATHYKIRTCRRCLEAIRAAEVTIALTEAP